MNNIIQSFSKTGKPHDNAVAESFFALLKREELYRTDYKSEREFIDAVNDYIHNYNTKNHHSKLHYKSPARYEEEYEEKN